MPLPIRRHDVVTHRPLTKRVRTQQTNELVAAHADVASAWWNRPRFDAWAALQQRRIVAADAVDDLRNLVKRDGPWPAGMVDASGAVRQEVFEYAAQVV